MRGIVERNGHIQITFEVKRKRYRTTLPIPPTPGNIKYAAGRRAAFIYQISTGETPEIFAEKSTSRVTTALTRWLTHKKKTVKASTYDGYRKSVSVLIRNFGELDVSKLTIGKIRDFCVASDASAKRLNNLLSPLRQSLQEMVEDEVISKNILTGWSYKKPRQSLTGAIDPFKLNEQQAILGILTGQAKNIIQFALWTGMRPSEYIALLWSDIDFINKTVTVVRAKTQAASEPEEPKTLAGIRTIKLLAPALSALIAQKKYTFMQGEEIFHNPTTNEAWAGDQSIRKTLWTPALIKAGVRYRRPYQTRHTFASMMLTAGEHPMWVAHQMGHADWSMIAKVYGKWMPEAMPNSGKKAEKLFG